MPVSIRKLAPEETERVFPQRRQQDVSEYVDALRGLAPGEVAAIERQGLADRAVKRRLGQAATALGYRVKWSRHSSSEQMYFQVLRTGPTKETNGRRRRRSAPPARSEPTPTSTRGRRPRSAPEASAPQLPTPGPARRGRRRKVAASG